MNRESLGGNTSTSMTPGAYMWRAYQALSTQTVIVEGPVRNQNKVVVEERPQQRKKPIWKVPPFVAMEKSLRLMYVIYAVQPTGVDDLLDVVEIEGSLKKEEVQKYVFDDEGIYYMGYNPYASMRYILNELLGRWDEREQATIFPPYRWPDNKKESDKLELLKSAEKELGIRMGIYPKNVWDSPEDYETQMEVYVNFAYITLKAGKKKLPSKESMETPLKIMFVIHNRDKFAYTTVDEFMQALQNVVGLSKTTVNQKVLGDRYSSLYKGLRVMMERYIPYLNNGRDKELLSFHNNWFYFDKSKRYNMLIQVAEKLYKAMEWKSEHSGKG